MFQYIWFYEAPSAEQPIIPICLGGAFLEDVVDDDDDDETIVDILETTRLPLASCNYY